MQYKKSLLPIGGKDFLYIIINQQVADFTYRAKEGRR